MSESRNYELKPCPFCGGAKINIYPHRWSGHGEGGTLYKAQCEGCGVQAESRAPQYPYTQEQEIGEAGAAEAWNRRAAIASETAKPQFYAPTIRRGWVQIPEKPNGAMLGLMAGEYLERPIMTRDQALTVYNAILAQARTLLIHTSEEVPTAAERTE